MRGFRVSHFSAPLVGSAPLIQIASSFVLRLHRLGLYFSLGNSMSNVHQRGRQLLRKTLLTATAIAAFPLAALAKDLPPTPEGAQKLAAILATYLGKAAAGAGAPISVAPEGSHYALHGPHAGRSSVGRWRVRIASASRREDCRGREQDHRQDPAIGVHQEQYQIGRRRSVDRR